MGAGIVLFVWLFVAAIGATLWGGSLWLFIAGRRRQSTPMIWLGGVPLAFGSLIAIVTLVGTIYGFSWNRKPANIYEMSFGSAPTQDVTGLQSSFYNFADTGTTFLKFKAAPATIGQLTKKPWKSLKGKPWQNENFHFFKGENTPDWWKPSKTKNAQIFIATNRFKYFAGENEILVYETKTGQTYYAFIGID